MCVCVCVCDIRSVVVYSWLDHKLSVVNTRPLLLVGSFGSLVRDMCPNSKTPCQIRHSNVNKVSLRAVYSTVLRNVKVGKSDVFLVVV